MRWSSALAYAVGLITTDGSLSKDGRHIILTSKDSQLLETFKKCLGKQNSLTITHGGDLTQSTAYKVQIGDIKFYHLLEKIGLTPNKTLTLGSLKIPDRYFRDFLRGHLDGDGSIINYIDRYNTHLNPKYIYNRLFVHFISASRPHLLWLRESILRLRGISGSFHKSVSKTNIKRHPMYLLKFSTKQAKTIINWMYYKSDLPCLLRKFLMAKPYLVLE